MPERRQSAKQSPRDWHQIAISVPQSGQDSTVSAASSRTVQSPAASLAWPHSGQNSVDFGGGSAVVLEGSDALIVWIVGAGDG